MFTGLIEATGTIRAVERGSRDWSIAVQGELPLAEIAIGESIAVSGVCLTVTALAGELFTVQLSAETVSRTAFGGVLAARLGSGTLVNLERALRLGGRLDGHLVQGHVDAVGRVERITPRGGSREIWFRVPEGAGRYIVEKGSIAVDGVSLTVNRIAPAGEELRFAVNIIPHTSRKTTLAQLREGELVNVETDIIGRYVERLLNRGGGCSVTGVTEQLLRDNGFV